MYGGTSNNPLKDTRQTYHGYEQKFGDIWDLPVQNNFQSIFPKH